MTTSSPDRAIAPGATEHADVLRLVGWNQRVLAVVGTEGLVRSLAERGCRVVCLGADKAVAEDAAEWSDRVIVGDLDHVDIGGEVGESRFDVVVIADVLGHLAAPQVMLRTLGRLLDPGGYLVASVPNVASAQLRLALAAGTFPYGALGLDDGAPRRLFTRGSLLRLLEAAELVPLLLQAVEAVPANRTSAAPPTGGSDAEVVDFVAAQPDARAHRFIAVAAPTPLRGAIPELIATLSRERDELAQRVSEGRWGGRRSGTNQIFDDIQTLYLTLLKNALTRSGFGQPQMPASLPADGLPPDVLAQMKAWLALHDLDVVRHSPPLWPAEAETMVTLPRLDNLQACLGRVVVDDIPGDFIETGVWRGGTSIFARGVLRALGDTARKVWVADSFQGLPKPDPARYPVDAGDVCWTVDFLAVSVEEVKANFEKYGLLDDQVRFLPGWFADTLPTAPIDELAVLRLDGDMYSSTTQALDALYPKLSIGGYVIIDDYGAVPSCKAAVDDWRRNHGIREAIVPTNDVSEVSWRKEW